MLTRQVENEYASLIRGDIGDTDSVNTLPILQPVECNNPEELAQLRSAGKWFRYLGAKGCYLWIHSLTREVTPLRPADYVEDEALTEAEEEEDAAGERYRGRMATTVIDESDSIEARSMFDSVLISCAFYHTIILLLCRLSEI